MVVSVAWSFARSCEMRILVVSGGVEERSEISWGLEVVGEVYGGGDEVEGSDV